MGTIDRYFWRAAALRFGAVVAIVVTMLTLENITRLAADVQKTETPGKLLGWLSLLLVPEQLSAAVPVAVFLGVALAMRQMNARGEWVMLQASGMGRWRMMAAPLLLGLCAAGFQLANQLELRPAGLRALDTLYLDMQGGKHGVPVSLDAPIALDNATTLFAQPAASGPPGSLVKVLIRHRTQVFSAPTAAVTALSGGVIALDLYDGTALSGLEQGVARSFDFHHLRVFGRPKIIDLVGNDARHRLARQDSTALIALARAGDPDSAAATAALAMRIDSALFCLMLPWLALALALPQRRGSTAFGLGWGVVLIVAHLKSAAFLEDSFAADAVLAAVLHTGLWFALTVWLVRLDEQLGEGWAEVASQRAIARVAALVRDARVSVARPFAPARLAHLFG
jgi:lipopolysaccharide export system permease protein